jgi:hypothetical protein
MEQKELTDRPPHPEPGTDPEKAKPWYLIAPGIWELLLNGSTQDNKSVLQYYEPNAKSVTDEIITHPYIEEVCFIDGAMADVTLGKEWGCGAYAYRYPGMKHGPYKASSTGVLQFVKCSPPVEKK